MRRRASVVLVLVLGTSGCGHQTPRELDVSSEVLRHPAVPGEIVWHELLSPDVAASTAFYADVVGWRPRHDSPSHVTLVGDFGSVAAMSIAPHGGDGAVLGAEARWVAVVAIEDGGSTGGAPAQLRDPGGAAVALLPLPACPFVRDKPLLSEFSWDELRTSDGPRAIRFYGERFGWTVLSEQHAGAGTYVVFGRAGLPMAGMYVDPALAVHGWTPYVQIVDLDAAVRRAVVRGATVTFGPATVPDGRLAQLRDPQGAAFGLRERPSSPLP